MTRLELAEKICDMMYPKATQISELRTQIETMLAYVGGFTTDIKPAMEQINEGAEALISMRVSTIKAIMDSELIDGELEAIILFHESPLGKKLEVVRGQVRDERYKLWGELNGIVSMEYCKAAFYQYHKTLMTILYCMRPDMQLQSAITFVKEVISQYPIFVVPDNDVPKLEIILMEHIQETMNTAFDMRAKLSDLFESEDDEEEQEKDMEQNFIRKAGTDDDLIPIETPNVRCKISATCVPAGGPNKPTSVETWWPTKENDE